jgi:hypothetical protein
MWEWTGIVLIAFVVGLFALSFRKPAAGHVKKGPSTKTRRASSQRSSAEARLILACMGDKAKAERLVNHEMNKKPGINREQAVLAVLETLERDRR